MGDFERTFGAGADTVGIISGFSYRPREHLLITAKNNCVILSSFEDAMAYAKRFPGNTLRNYGKGKEFLIEFDDQNFAFDFSARSYDLHKDNQDHAAAFYKAIELKENLVGCARHSLGGECTSMPVRTPPPSSRKIIEKLKEQRLVFLPICKDVCIIIGDDDEGSLEAAIVNEEGASTIVYRNHAPRMYETLMGMNGSGQQFR